jgi:hypothetical protein
MILKMAERTDHVWKSQSLAATYLEGVRAAIPLALEQIDVMLRLIAGCDWGGRALASTAKCVSIKFGGKRHGNRWKAGPGKG